MAADSINFNPLLEQYGNGITPRRPTDRDITLGFENTFPRSNRYPDFGFEEYNNALPEGSLVEEYQPPSGMGLGFDYKPMSTYTPNKNPLNFEPLTMGNVANYGGSNVDRYDPSGFNGFNQSQMKTDGSFASVGAGVGALVGGPVGSGIGAVGGTAVDMYLSYQANEERKKADRQRLEEARRQQKFSNRQAERDRKLAASQYGDKMGFLNAQEDRTKESFEANTKQNRLNMLQNAMTNSLKNSEMVRNIFAKRGVV